MNRRVLKHALTTLMLMLACAAWTACGRGNRSITEDDIREAVFRYQFLQQTNGVCFLKVNGHDPSDEFMRRFAGQVRPVQKASQGDADGSVASKGTRQKGVVFNVGSIRWITWIRGTEVEVSGDYRGGDSGAAWYTYSLKSENGSWTVWGHQLHRIE